MKYMLLIYQEKQIWNRLIQAERQEPYRKYRDVNED